MNCWRWAAAIVFGVTAGVVNGADERVAARAVAGSPFGVGFIGVEDATGGLRPQPVDVTYHVEASDDRIFYPAFFREAIPGSTHPGAVSTRGAYFLFKGDEPLTVRFSDGRTTTRHELAVEKGPDKRAGLLAEWWSRYQQSCRTSDAMPAVGQYTTHMLSRRLGLQPPTGESRRAWRHDELLGSFLGFEEMRLAMQSDRMLDDGDAPEPADLPLPAAVLPPAIDVPEFEDAAIEPLAMRVPEECFYLRFGSYGNYRWFRDTLNQWGGNLREIVSVRSVDYDIAGRMERQLVLKDRELGTLLGEAAIRDMAVIGTDTFVREGASLGVLFRENQPGVLAAAIQTQRLAAKQDRDVTEQTVEMAGVKVSLLTSPGNQVRSYYAADGEFHFITTSSALARRFVETGKGVRRLSDLKEFRYARTKHAIAKGNPILAYLSDPFIRQLVSPSYRVEMTRRMKAEADVELVSLARLAAIGEGAAHRSVEELVAGGFLPDTFGKRADEAIPLIINGKVLDSLRGARRTFLPVADVLVAGVTRSEAEAYQKFSQAYQGLYRRMDPISISVTRDASGEDRERIVLDVSITPFTRQNLGALANWLPDARRQQVNAGAGVLVLLQVAAQSQVFAGLLDSKIEYRLEHGRVDLAADVQEHPPFFLGEHGKGYRQLLDLKGERSADGYFESRQASRPDRSGRFGLDYGREWGEWWAAALRPSTLEEVTPELSVAEGLRPAHLRLKIGNLGESKMAPMLRSQLYCLERAASRANARTLDSYHEQLKVGETGALSASSDVFGAQLVCPLGGDYRRDPPDYQFSTHQPWYSTAWPAPKTPWQETPFFERLSVDNLHEPPAEYEPRMLKWFKGLDAEVRFEQQTMFSRVELEVSKAR